ncbi:hypothetical protein [Deinococcus petrolearius]|uniref:Uncharacterized protein n=1 Tax=Deinococcus petrolearius TaxID=1751295 RepID=A0ABW1DPM2_9DEIO
MGRTQQVAVLLTDLEVQQLTAAAGRVGVDVALYLRAAALNAARATVDEHRPTYSREQLMSIHRRAQNKGHVWTEDELRRRGLPLYWCRAWVDARLAEGATRVQLAVESGHPERAVTGYLRTVYGLGKFHRLTESTQQQVRAQVAAGKSREAVAADLGLSSHTVGTYARGLATVRERQYQDVVEQVGAWPAPLSRIAERAFGGDAPAASAWLRKKIKRGWIKRVRKGWYDLGTVPVQAGRQAADHASPPLRSSPS